MSFDLPDILFNFDYWGVLLLGYPLNIILIILIIFKTPKEMKTHSRILIQNCVLDILILTVQVFVQGFKILDAEGNAVEVYPNGILFILPEKNFNPLICYVAGIVWVYFGNSNLHGLCVQFIYRYLVLNRNMKINIRRYLSMLSVALIVQLFYILVVSFFINPYSFGGIKYFDNFNKTMPFVQYAHVEKAIFSLNLI